MSKNMDKKPIIKYFLQVVVIVLIGAGIFFGIGYYRYRTSPEYKKYQDLLALKERYMADTYGGDTPEETLELFISALKAGDIDLASKYFVLDKQEEWKKNLDAVKDGGQLLAMISDLTKARRGNNISDSSTLFVSANEKNEEIATINIARNVNGKWKIVSL